MHHKPLLSATSARRLFAIHRWTGLLAGLVILFLSLTGTGLVFITEIDRLLNGDLLVSEPAGPAISPERAVAIVQQAYPGARANRVELPRFANSVYIVQVGVVKNPKPFNQVSVDPYTARIRGTRMQNKSFAFILRQLHLRFFFFGWQGRVVVGVFGLVLLLSTITGFLIYGRFIRALPHWWSIRRERGFQISTSDWHKLVGILALAFNLIIAVTGTVLGLENLARFSPAVAEAIHPGPGKGDRAPPSSTLKPAITPSHALMIARSAIPGLVPISITLPNAKKSHYVVSGNLEHQIAMEEASYVHIHALTGKVIFRHNAREARVITRAYNWMDPLHFGYWGGIWSQILYVIFGLTTAFLSITGFMIWWLKIRRRKSSGIPRNASAAALRIAIVVTAGVIGTTPATAQIGEIVVGRNVQVSRASPADTHYEVLAAADPRDPARMIVGSFIYSVGNTTAGTVVYATRDGGKSWSPTLRGDVLVNTSDPAPAYGGDHTAYFTVSSLGPPGTKRESRKMLMFRSTDGGAKWDTPTSLTYSDRQYVTVDATGGKYNGRVYVNGNNRVPYGVSDFVVFTSTDGGRSFSGPGKREGFGKFTADAMGNAVVASDGTLVGVFAAGKSLYAITSIDGGHSLLPAVAIDTEYVAAGNRKGANNNVVGMPLVAVDGGSGPRRDHLYAVWADRRSGRSRILFSVSTDKGVTWSKSRQIDDVAASDSIDNFMPTIAVNRSEVVGVMWYDRRRHSDNLGWDARFTASTNGGTSFLPSVQVSEQGTTFGPTTPWTALRSSVARAKGDAPGIVVDVSLNTFTFQGGDTAGLAADAAGIFHPFWIDNRTGVPQIWTAPVAVNATGRTNRGVDVSDRVTFEIIRNSYDRASRIVTVVVQLRNASAQTARGPFQVEVLGVSSQLGDATILPADTDRGGRNAEWRFAESALAPGAVSSPKTWRFALSNLQPFRSGDRYRMGLLQLKALVTSGAATPSPTNH